MCRIGERGSGSLRHSDYHVKPWFGNVEFEVELKRRKNFTQTLLGEN
jgi:hypothetical protein